MSEPKAFSGTSEDEDEEDVGRVGALIPDGIEAPAELIGDEMLSRATTEGPAASEFVLENMRNDPRPKVQAKGCSAVSQIAETPPGRTTLHEKGAVEVVVAAMSSAMPDEIELQAKGCSAIANLSIGEGESAVLSKGGLAAVLAAASAHPAEASVQLKVCTALGNIAYGSAGEARVLAGGGLEAVVTAMKAHSADAALQEEGVDALVNIADSADAKKRLLALGGLAVVAAAKKHANCAATAGELATGLVAAAKA